MLKCVPEVSEWEYTVVAGMCWPLVVKEVDLLHLRADATHVVLPVCWDLDEKLDVEVDEHALGNKEGADSCCQFERIPSVLGCHQPIALVTFPEVRIKKLRLDKVVAEVSLEQPECESENDLVNGVSCEVEPTEANADQQTDPDTCTQVPKPFLVHENLEFFVSHCQEEQWNEQSSHVGMS